MTWKPKFHFKNKKINDELPRLQIRSWQHFDDLKVLKKYSKGTK